MPHGIWPQADQDHPHPFVHCLEHGNPGLLLQVPDMAVRYAILEVGVDPTVQQALSLCLTIGNERIVSKPTVVRVIMEYFYATLIS